MDKLDKQMSFNFADGGMATAKAEVDPISGNEVPPGSSPKEVRDDVDVKISEGEYIFPADVVQFYGVDKLEKMIAKAKESLGDMEARGRMGTEENEHGEEDDLPLSDEELETEGEMDDAEALAFAEGGVVATFDPSQYSYSGAGTQTKVFINAAGEKRPVLFINGQPQGAIPPGFVEDSPEARKNLQTPNPTDTTSDLQTPTATQGVQNYEGGDRTQQDSKPVGEWGPEDFEGWDKGRQFGSALARGAGSLLGGALTASPIGAILGGKTVQEAMKRDTQTKLAELTARINNPNIPPEDKEKYQSIVDSIKTPVDEEKTGLLSKVFGDFSLVDTIFGKPKTPVAKATTATAQNQRAGEGKTSTNRVSGSLQSSKRPVARPDGTSGSSTSGRSTGSNSGGRSSSGAPGNGGSNSQGSEATGRAEGGLIKSKTVKYSSGGLVKKRR